MVAAETGTLLFLQGHPQSGSDTGRPPEKDPQQHPADESADESDHVGGGVKAGGVRSCVCRGPSAGPSVLHTGATSSSRLSQEASNSLQHSCLGHFVAAAGKTHPPVFNLNSCPSSFTQWKLVTFAVSLNYQKHHQTLNPSSYSQNQLRFPKTPDFGACQYVMASSRSLRFKMQTSH